MGERIGGGEQKKERERKKKEKEKEESQQPSSPNLRRSDCRNLSN